MSEVGGFIDMGFFIKDLFLRKKNKQNKSKCFLEEQINHFEKERKQTRKKIPEIYK